MAAYPATNLTTDAGKTHYQTTYWKRRSLDWLQKKTYFITGAEPDELPQRSGKTVQWWRPVVPSANTTPSSEGVVGTGLSYDTDTVSATVQQYSDFYTVSRLYAKTALDNAFETLNKLASYRAALTMDTLIRIELASVTTTDANTLGASFTGQDIRLQVTNLNANDVTEGPRGASMFLLIAHPYALYDLKSDNTAGGFIDVMKYANAGALLAGEVGKFDNARIVASTNVGTSGTAPNVIYDAYLLGNESVGAVDLAGEGPTKVTNPDSQMFNVTVQRTGPNPSDPEGNTAGFVSYWFAFVAKRLKTTNDAERYRTIQVDVSPV